ncbi:hypothetical protein ACVT81_001669 [Yersinia enterocolitica]|uniref:hypothetical protein n=1 Tax=Yersinia intermedia TaxID=631 RepID=UPI0039C6B2EC
MESMFDHLLILTNRHAIKDILIDVEAGAVFSAIKEQVTSTSVRRSGQPENKIQAMKQLSLIYIG